MRAILAKWALFLALAVILSSCETASHYRSTTLGDGKGGRSVVLMPVDIELSELQAGGFPEPKADWTDLARKLLTEAIDAKLNGQQAKLIVANPETVFGDPLAVEAKLIELHEAVGTAILLHKISGIASLPTKKDTFDWTLGPDVKVLHDRYGSDYALFIWMRDSYSSPGRVAAIVIAAALGVAVQGGVQAGFASLVDLRTGDVLWFNRLARGTGDVRNPAGAANTAQLLLADFPK